MKFKEIAALSKENRDKKRKELELELLKEQGQIAAGTMPKNPGNIKQIKKQLAMIEQVSQGGEAQKS